MNKKIRKIIACTLTINALYTISPTTNLPTVSAYASCTDGTNLKDIDLNHGHIDFDKNNLSYYIAVDISIDSIKITAKPEDEDYTVTIDGHKVDKDDDYEKKVSLNEGINTFKIKVKDESSDHEKIYTLNIFRGSGANVQDSSHKKNQWVYVNGHMQYNDPLGNPLKNTWFWDNNIKKYHFLNSSGYMHTGWLYYNSRWYYLDENGVMLNGWQYLNGNWYYLNYGGDMITGWFRDKDGTWYYLDNNGSMLTGWIINNGKYYHLNSNGAMDYNVVVDGFMLGADGAWVGR